MRYALLAIDKAAIYADDSWPEHVGIVGAYPTREAAIEAFREEWGESEDEGHFVSIVDLRSPDKKTEVLLDN